MLAMLQLMSEKYGSVDGYVKTCCGLLEEDIAIIRNNLISDDAPTLLDLAT